MTRIETIERRLDAAALEQAEMQATFDLRWKADMRAIEMWQAAHPDRSEVWPDHADMVVWLLERADQVQAERDHEELVASQLQSDLDRSESEAAGWRSTAEAAVKRMDELIRAGGCL